MIDIAARTMKAIGCQSLAADLVRRQLALIVAACGPASALAAKGLCHQG